ncbi:MAG: hypothetical protein IKX24_08465 [Prevotella sp.]|nr:hypothetical protein [Prevotella sp.]
METKKYPITKNDPQILSEPLAASLSESVRKTDLFGQGMGLSHTDKKTIMKHLKQDNEQDEPFRTDEFGRIALTQRMRETATKTEGDYEEGNCLSEDDFKQRFAKWL